MREFINVNDVLDHIADNIDAKNMSGEETKSLIYKAIDSFYREDVSPVIYSNWEHHRQKVKFGLDDDDKDNFPVVNYFTCAICDTLSLHKTSFCPTCGSLMEEFEQ